MFIHSTLYVHDINWMILYNTIYSDGYLVLLNFIYFLVDFSSSRRQSIPNWTEKLCQCPLLGCQGYSWWLYMVCMFARVYNRKEGEYPTHYSTVYHPFTGVSDLSSIIHNLWYHTTPLTTTYVAVHKTAASATRLTHAEPQWLPCKPWNHRTLLRSLTPVKGWYTVL